MTITKLHELILARLYDFAKSQGYGKEINLDGVAAEFGETDKAKVFYIACDLEDWGLIVANHTMDGSYAFIKPEGERLIQDGGTTGIIPAFLREPGRFLISVDRRDQSTKIYGSVSNSNMAIHSQGFNQGTIELFRAIQESIQTKVASDADREQLTAKVAELKAEVGKKGLVDKYVEFMAVAANHMEVFGPFIPALAKLLAE